MTMLVETISIVGWWEVVEVGEGREKGGQNCWWKFGRARVNTGRNLEAVNAPKELQHPVHEGRFPKMHVASTREIY